TYFFQSTLRLIPGDLATFGNNTFDQDWVGFVGTGPFQDRLLLLQDSINQRLFTVQAANAYRATPLLNPALDILSRIEFMQPPDRAAFRLPRVCTPHTGRISLHGADLPGDRVRLFPQPNPIAA